MKIKYKPPFNAKAFKNKEGLELTPAEMKHPNHLPKFRPEDCRHCRYTSGFMQYE